MKTTIENIEDEIVRQRYRIVLAAEKNGVTTAAKLFNTTRQRVARLLKRFKEGGIEALKNPSRKIDRHPDQLDSAQEKRIVTLKKKFPALSAREIKEKLGLNCTLKTILKKIKNAGIDVKPVERPDYDLNNVPENVKPLDSLFLSIVKIDDMYDYASTTANERPDYAIAALDYKTGISYIGYANSNTPLNIAIFLQQLHTFLRFNNSLRRYTIVPLRKNIISEFVAEDSLLDKIRKGLDFNFSTAKDEIREKLRKHVRKVVATQMSMLNTIPDWEQNFLMASYLVNLQSNLRLVLRNRSLYQYIKFSPSVTNSMIPIFDKDIHKSGPAYLKYKDEFIAKTVEFVFIAVTENGDKLKNDVVIMLSDVLLFLLGSSHINKQRKIETLIVRGKILQHTGRYKDGQLCLKKAYQLAERIGEHRYYPTIFINQGNGCSDRGDYGRAKQRYVSALSFYHKKSNGEGKLQLIMLLADLDIKFSRYEKSIKKLLLCEEKLQQSNQKEKLTKIYVGLAAAYLNICRHNLSHEYFHKAEQLATSRSDKTPFVEAFISYGSLLHHSNIATFVKYLDMFISYAENSSDPKIKIAVFEKLGLYHLIKDNFSKAEDFFKKGLILAQETGNPYTVAELYSHLGMCNLCSNKANDALNYVNKSLKIFIRLNLDNKIAEQYIMLGASYYINSENDKAIQFLRKGMYISKKFGKVQERPHSIIHLGIVHYLMEDYRKSIYYNRKQLNKYLKMGYIDGLYSTYNNIALSYMKLYKFRGAIINFNKALKYANILHSRFLVCMILNNKAQMYLMWDRLAEARRISEEALAIAREIDEKGILEMIENVLRKIKEKEKSSLCSNSRK